MLSISYIDLNVSRVCVCVLEYFLWEGSEEWGWGIGDFVRMYYFLINVYYPNG